MNYEPWPPTVFGARSIKAFFENYHSRETYSFSLCLFCTYLVPKRIKRSRTHYKNPPPTKINLHYYYYLWAHLDRPTVLHNGMNSMKGRDRKNILLPRAEQISTYNPTEPSRRESIADNVMVEFSRAMERCDSVSRERTTPKTSKAQALWRLCGSTKAKFGMFLPMFNI